jgi:hypothetical protein
MSKKKTFIGLLVTGVVGAALLFGVFNSQTAFAQSVTPTQSAPNTQQAQPPQMGRGGHGGPGGERGGMVADQDLATALGVTTEQLQAAYKTANAEALKEAVSKGLITQAQADQMTADGFGPRHFGDKDGIDYNALLAKALGITTEKLQAAMQQVENTNLDNAVKNGTMTQAQADMIKAQNALRNDTKFQSSMQSAYEAAIKQAVTDGVITQAQADAILQQQPKWGGGGPGFDGGHGRGGRDGFKSGPNSSGGQTAPQPTTIPTSNGL